jgi:predicted O-linked N-acetylglucosamine transferase (SPINDLY family)
LLSLCDDESVQQTCAQNWVEHKFARIAELPGRARRQDDRIRVAYLSPDFRNHATSHLLSRRIELHDRRQFRIVGMSFGPKANDAMRRRISSAFDAFFDVSAVSDLTAAMLQAEGVDIAVDLAGHTEYARTGFLARRPPAVQANYLGYPGMMGARFIDYLIADPRIIPEARKPLFTEKIAYLPDT